MTPLDHPSPDQGALVVGSRPFHGPRNRCVFSPRFLSQFLGVSLLYRFSSWCHGISVIKRIKFLIVDIIVDLLWFELQLGA